PNFVLPGLLKLLGQQADQVGGHRRAGKRNDLVGDEKDPHRVCHTSAPLVSKDEKGRRTSHRSRNNEKKRGRSGGGEKRRRARDGGANDLVRLHYAMGHVEAGSSC